MTWKEGMARPALVLIRACLTGAVLVEGLHKSGRVYGLLVVRLDLLDSGL